MLKKKRKMANANPLQTKHVPKDAQVIMSILKEMGINDYEPQVIVQLLEFTYRYVTNTLEDAKVYANHANKKVIDMEDVQLAVNMQLDKNFTTPPPRDMLFEVARSRNAIPLPQIKPHCGIRLPPDRYCMTACNYEIKGNKKPTATVTKPTTTITTTKPSTSSSQNNTPKIVGKTLLTKRTLQTIPNLTVTEPVPMPVIKFTSSTDSSSQNQQNQPQEKEKETPHIIQPSASTRPAQPPLQPPVIRTVIDLDDISPGASIIKKRITEEEN